MNYNLNIITLNIPYPPDYGGMIDTFYRIQSLNNLGVRIHLHCFEYGRSHSKELEAICEKVSYYPRKSNFLNNFSFLPYIISSRKSEILLKNLSKNDFPILFDGLHTTYYLNHPKLAGRRKLIRMHNIEHQYYKNLAKQENHLTNRLYFKIESFRLKLYEKVLLGAKYLLPISEIDHNYLNNKYHTSRLLAPFHPFDDVVSMTGSGEYLLYHGDLSVNENTITVNSLIDNVFSKVPFKCIIAGKNPPKQLLVKVSGHSNIDIVANPENKVMTQLISNSHINILPALEMNGFKIKLLFALFAGRHCIINSKMVSRNDLGSLCHVADSDIETTKLIRHLMQEEFSDYMIEERRRVLLENYSNRINSERLFDLIFNQSSPFL